MCHLNRFVLPARLLIVACALAIVGLGIHMAQPWGDNYAYQDLRGYFQLAIILFWAIAPYLLMYWLLGRGWRQPAAACVLRLGVVVVAVFWLWTYVQAAVIHVDAQGGLAFLFGPLVQWAAIAGIVVLSAVVQGLARRPRR